MTNNPDNPPTSGGSTTSKYISTENLAWEMFLMRLRYRDAKTIQTKVNEPLLLDSTEYTYLVHKGNAEVFTAPLQNGKVSGALDYLASIRSGNLIFGFDITNKQRGILVDSSRGTELLQVPYETLRNLAKNKDFRLLISFLIDRWVVRITEQLFDEADPREFKLVQPNEEQYFDKGDIIRTSANVMWVGHRSGKSHFLGRHDFPITDSSWLYPLSKNAWMVAQDELHVHSLETRKLLALDTAWRSFDNFQNLFLDMLTTKIEKSVEKERERLQRQRELDDAQLESAFYNIADTLGESYRKPFAGVSTDSAMLAACQLIGDSAGINIVAPPDFQRVAFKNPAYAIAKASRVRIRKVGLEFGWWEHDSGPLLGYMKEDERPVALIPDKPGSYNMHDPTYQTITPVTAEVAEELAHFGTMFYRSFGTEPVTAWDLIRFGLRETRKDMRLILFLGMFISLLNIATPIITQIVFDDIIPSGDTSQLLQVGGVLLLSAVAIAMFQVVQAVAVLRIQSKAEGSVQAALWDRLLDLPTDFFRDYTSGDLAMRAMGISIIRKLLSGTVTLAVLGSIASIFNLVLLFYYSVTLALVALVLIVISVGVTIGAGYISIRIQRRLTDQQGKISGYVLQFITAMPKFRVAAAQNRVFAVWARHYSEQRKMTYRARNVENWLNVFHAMYPVVTLMVIFGMIQYTGSVDLSVGEFLAFNTAFTNFLVASLELSGAFLTIMAIIPLYERARPILETEPEVDENTVDPGELTGNIEVSHITFGYDKTAPPILKDVSFEIQPNQFVAVVGPSGGGKSTLMRLMLGFERPDSGVVLYDGKNLADLDVQSVRRQIGVVLQNSQIMAGGAIFHNIIGATNLTMDDAWEAARMAGLEADIKDMPMGMYTVLSQGGSTISGGQRQRLLIARALVTRPRILIFDEATSALDNETQAIVTKSVEDLNATFIVIAHRLSTVINADHILVVDNGELVEQGTYDELMEMDGMFARLAERQLA